MGTFWFTVFPPSLCTQLPAPGGPEPVSYTHLAGEIKVAIGNARLYESDFKKSLTGKTNRSFARYQQVRKLLKEALSAKAGTAGKLFALGMAARHLTAVRQQSDGADYGD